MRPFGSHPTPEQLASFANGMLEPAEREEIETHVGVCATCCVVLRGIPNDPLVARLRQLQTTANWIGQDPAEDPRPLDFTSEIPRNLIDHPRYEVIKQLGNGGMGVVFQAQHRLMGRTVALKVIRGSLLKNAAAIERFRQEVKAAARLSHRNIVTAYDAEQAGDVHFLIMEYVPGTDLASLVKSRGPLSVLHACNFIMQAAQGLQHAFEVGMVHRDIKPHNLMVTPKGAVKILDFGLARLATDEDDQDQFALTREGVTLGTPDFMSPEQARNSRQADVRSDIYSLGCTLYFLLAGRPPFNSGTAMEKVLAHCERHPKPLAELREGLPPELLRIVDWMMAKDPAARPQTPKEVVESLKPFALPKSSSEPPLAIVPTQVDLVAKQPVLPQQSTTPGIDGTIAGTTASFDPAAFGQTSRFSPSSLLVRGKAVWLSAGVIILLLLATWKGIGALNRDEISAVRPDSEWANLLAEVRPESHAVAGEWQRTGDELRVNAAESARIVLPGSAPDEYDFEVEFTRQSGVHSIALIFVAGGQQASFELDAWDEQLAGIQMIDGVDLRVNGTGTSMGNLENGRRYTARVQVRRRGVQGFLDGRLLATYRGDGSNLSPLEFWRLPNADSLGLGAYQSETVFHRARIRPATN